MPNKGIGDAKMIVSSVIFCFIYYETHKVPSFLIPHYKLSSYSLYKHSLLHLG